MEPLQDNPPLPPMSTVFPYLRDDPTDLPPDADPFTITTSTGFLPYKLPLCSLPSPFDSLTKILDDMPVVKENGEPGLLAHYKLGPLIDGGALPDLTSEIDNLTVPGSSSLDLHAITAAFRDYSFVASSYLLEPCWEKWNEDKNDGYGLGRQVLPRCIASPLVKCAEILDIPPFMSYAASYALYNYYLVDPAVGYDEYTNFRLIRAFEQGLDPKSSEAGFILTHIDMVASTSDLIRGVIDVLSAIDSTSTSTTTTTNEALKSGLHLILSSMTTIEASMEKMWTHSLPKDYISYRTFIFGITSQSMFPSGVVYESCFGEVPQQFRGESGANDSIIPLLDHLCEIPMPTNPLTDILKDFRQYRPKPHRVFLSYVLSKATELGVRDFITHKSDKEVVVLYLRVLDHVRSFRWRHWMFAREYIIKRTKHPTATGGSPIVTWLPNQLGAVMQLMKDVYSAAELDRVVAGHADGLDEVHKDMVRKIMENVDDQQTRLDKEVRKYCEERGA